MYSMGMDSSEGKKPALKHLFTLVSYMVFVNYLITELMMISWCYRGVMVLSWCYHVSKIQ